jgi:hypothetical protein
MRFECNADMRKISNIESLMAATNCDNPGPISVTKRGFRNDSINYSIAIAAESSV